MTHVQILSSLRICWAITFEQKYLDYMGLDEKKFAIRYVRLKQASSATKIVIMLKFCMNQVELRVSRKRITKVLVQAFVVTCGMQPSQVFSTQCPLLYTCCEKKEVAEINKVGETSL